MLERARLISQIIYVKLCKYQLIDVFKTFPEAFHRLRRISSFRFDGILCGSSKIGCSGTN